MSMELTTIMELIQTGCFYTLYALILPYIVFHKYLSGKSFSDKFLFCIIVGNFYMINIVFLVFLLHIDSQITMYLFAILPVLFLWLKLNRPKIRYFIMLIFIALSRFLLGEAKIRTIATLLFYHPRRFLRKLRKAVWKHLSHHLLEWIALLGCTGFNLWYYSYHTIHNYTYGASDLTVHHQWINAMDGGVIFYHGIYPFGFHNVIYFLHSIFQMETVSLLRTFGVIETIYIYVMLYLLLRKICRSRFTPILGMVLFTLPNLFNFQATMRYQWSLPQEFAMVFLYPCAYYLIQFFRQKREELAEERKRQKDNTLYAWLDLYNIHPSTVSLILFALSFSMTLAVHFYITIIAVLLCSAIAIAHLPHVLHYRYFLSLLATGLLSVMIAVTPMGIAYLQGTELEGSLYWAMSVMQDSSAKNKTTDSGKNTTDSNAKSDTVNPHSSDPSGRTGISTQKNSTNKQHVPSAAEKTTLPIRIFQKLRNISIRFYEIMMETLNTVYEQDFYTLIILLCLELLMAACFLLILLPGRFYWRGSLGICIYLFFLIVLYCADRLGLPAVMDQARSRIFLAYATPLLLAAAVDAVYCLLAWPFRYHRITEILPAGLTAATVFLVISQHQIKPLNITYSLQTPGQMYCNYRILKNYPEPNWTVVSTTDDLQILSGRGWHTEVTDFLASMNNYNTKNTFRIPTKYVFFYIEKKPLRYGAYNPVTEEMQNFGMVSKGEAELPAVYSGISCYAGENRYNLESKFYYWAKAFEEKYPNEFKIYYEDDLFICYKLEQNDYHLYNFAIDYGFND